MTDPAMPPVARPRRVDVAASYNLGVETYETLWSPVIVPPAAAVVVSLGLTCRSLVVDVGAGTGALLAAVQSAAPGARVVAVDASFEMLRAAHRRGVASVHADALALPLADSTADAVLLAYVLFHLPDPAQGLAEAARVLRVRGRVGTVTWAWERGSRAHAVWDEILTDAGVPPLPPRRVDTGLDRPGALDGLLRSAGLHPERIWLHQLHYRWDRSSFWKLTSGSGANRARLDLVENEIRVGVLAHLTSRLEELRPEDFAWEGEVICAVATKRD